MRTTPLGPAGLEGSFEGLGCMGMSTTYGANDDRQSTATLHRAVEGVTLFDTAEVYGPHHNERLVGAALARVRDEVAIATKVGFGFTEDGKLAIVEGRPVVDGRPEHVKAAVEGSLQRLGTDRIDLLYLHRIDPAVPIEDTIGALHELVEQGKIRYLGLSEASAATIRRAHAVHPLTAVQTEYSLFERGVEANGVLDTVRELGIGFVPTRHSAAGSSPAGSQSTSSTPRTSARAIRGCRVTTSRPTVASSTPSRGSPPTRV
jgi:aryl-alcohol dehydrogenase-like predicted oxidoreductase